MGDQSLQNLRKEMEKQKIDIYIVPTSDFHASEYVGEYFKCRKYLTGFSGSQGTAVVTKTEAGLWTDGRYFIQAERQIQDSGFQLFKMGQKNVPTVKEFVREKLPEQGKIGFDGRTVSALFGEELLKIAEEKQGTLEVDVDLVGDLWKERPELPTSKLWILEDTYAGESLSEKLKRIREEMEKEKAEIHVMTTLDDIAWTLNLRGDDIPHFPVFLSYLVIEKETACLYVNLEDLNESIEAYLKENQIRIQSYDQIYEDLEVLQGRVLLDRAQVNYRIFKILEKKCEVRDRVNPAYLMKAIKNKRELENIRKAHLKDGVAMTKWIRYVKQELSKGTPLNEYSVSEKLEAFRREQEHFIDLSFDSIVAYKENAAMMHYTATKEQYAEIRPEGFLLCDSGAHYLEGSTDITRTFSVGPLTQEEKKFYTLTLIANLNLANAKFLYGCTGQSLDILARGPLWDLGVDYRCGTGHGIGYLLNIHEGPNGFRYRKVPERSDGGILTEGMVTTDEPGVYVEGKYGIRLENELICLKDEENEYGQFMHFETVTYCPFDIDSMDLDLMTLRDKERLNQYHEMVYEKLSPYLEDEEKRWLAHATRKVE